MRKSNQPMFEPKIYLGDSVYAEDTPEGLTLTTENGMGPSNTIYLDPQVIEAFIKYADKTGWS